MFLLCCFFFFFKQKTAYEMRISDWSSDVCSSDLYLLSEPQAKPIVSALGLPPTAGEWLEQRGRELDWRLKKFAQRLKRDALEGVRYRDDRLQISPVRTIATPDAEALADRLDAMMPRIRITELLHEVAQETGFLAAFTNLRTGEPCPNENALLATILADATNLGLSRMAAASQGVTRDQLLWTHDAYIRDDSYRAALAVLINAHHRLPFSRVWGDGPPSSSDGQFFRGATRGASFPNEDARPAPGRAVATNPGLALRAAAGQGVTRDQLLGTHVAYIRGDSYRAALAVLSNAHHRLPFSRVWGEGTTSSSDGQFFRGAKRGASGGDINARYGVDHGFSFYTHNSDQRAPYHVNVISAATHEAPYVLDGQIGRAHV